MFADIAREFQAFLFLPKATRSNGSTGKRQNDGGRTMKASFALLALPLWLQFADAESPPASMADVRQADSFAFKE